VRKDRFTEKVAVVTGAGGAIGGAIASALAAEGAGVAIWDIDGEAASKRQDRIISAGGWACSVACDVTVGGSVRAALQQTVEEFGRVDFLVCSAGGNRRDATTSLELAFFDVPETALRSVTDLNYVSVVLPAQIVGRALAARGEGAIVNIASISGIIPLSRVFAYSAAKASVINLTQWLAVHMARSYSPAIRVNAVAPGFVLTDQNSYLLVDPGSGDLTARGRAVVERVPAGRFGKPEDIVGAVLWLLSDEARFVTGALVPVDGGFSADSGI
jgi:NAD(P)-dependent dehydrogenase (short-subunit alcohol dehydrogenase family)